MKQPSQHSLTSSTRSPTPRIGGGVSPMSSGPRMRRTSAESRTIFPQKLAMTSGRNWYGTPRMSGLLISLLDTQRQPHRMFNTSRLWGSSLGLRQSPGSRVLDCQAARMRYESFQPALAVRVPIGGSREASTLATSASTSKPIRLAR